VCDKKSQHVVSKITPGHGMFVWLVVGADLFREKNTTICFEKKYY
jgi:hypothetical protein